MQEPEETTSPKSKLALLTKELRAERLSTSTPGNDMTSPVKSLHHFMCIAVAVCACDYFVIRVPYHSTYTCAASVLEATTWQSHAPLQQAQATLASAQAAPAQALLRQSSAPQAATPVDKLNAPLIELNDAISAAEAVDDVEAAEMLSLDVTDIQAQLQQQAQPDDNAMETVPTA